MQEQKEIYLDHAATTPVREEVLDAMLPYFSENYGNPSSLYSVAEKSKDAIEDSRREVASVLGCKPSEIVFTSGGTESDNAAIKGVALASKDKGNHIITSSIEHHAVLDSCKFLEDHFGFDVTYLPVDQYGRVDPDEVQNSLTNNTILVSIMYANNEIGTIQPISAISSVIKEYGNQIGRQIPFHTDAVQAAGYLDLDIETLSVDLLSLSGHKIYGPKGVGILYIRSDTPFLAYQSGGGQERGNRSGTENVASIVGISTALKLSEKKRTAESKRCSHIRDELIEKILSIDDEITLHGDRCDRLPNNVNIGFPNIDGEMLVLALNNLYIYTSTGSACSTGSQEPSHVLQALGISRESAWGSIRITIGKLSARKDVDFIVNAISNVFNDFSDHKNPESSIEIEGDPN